MLIRPPSGKKVLWQEMLRHELLAAVHVALMDAALGRGAGV